MTALARLASVKGRERPGRVLTTVNAILQRVPPRDIVGPAIALGRARQPAADVRLIAWLELNGFNRASTVREAGDYAVRGGIIDLFAPGMADPVRLDFFGDTLESIRSFDPETQRTKADCARSISCRWRNSSSPPTPSGCFVPVMWRPSARRPPTTCSTKR